MEAISLALFLLGLLGYLVSEDYIGHIWGASFMNTCVLFFLLSLESRKEFSIETTEIFFIYISLSILLLSGLFVIRGKVKSEKVDEIS